MEASVILFLILTASGLCHGITGVLPHNYIGGVGGAVTFTTTVSPSPVPFLVITWMGPSSKTIITSSTVNVSEPEYTDRITLYPSTGSLELRNLAVSDTGDYRVTIITQDAQTHIGNCKLVVLIPVSNVVATTSSTDWVELSSVRLSCSSSGSSPSFRWFNGSSEVTAGDRVQITDGGATMTIVSVTRYDQGPFKCHASNDISNGTSDPLHVSVSYGPENTHLATSPSQEFYAEGSDISLSCSAVSRPPAQFTWVFNGVKLPDTGPVLTLTNIRISQGGRYICQAFNNKTLKNDQSLPSSVAVVAAISNVKLNASTTHMSEFHSSVRLSCSSSGSSPSFSWFNVSSEVTAGGRVQITDGGSTMTIMNVSRHDQGPFRCFVSNLVSNETSDPVNLFIIFGPENTDLTVSPSQQYHDEGTDVILKCSVASNPALFQWFMNGNPLKHTGPELRLMKIQMSDSGNYSCQVFNSETGRNETSQPSTITVRKSNISNVVITPNSTDLVEFNSSVHLSCSSSGSFPSFVWFNDSSEVASSDRVHLTDDDATLSIISVTRYDQGPFRCHVFNNFSNYTSEPVRLSISYGPENMNLKLSPPGGYYEEGADIILSCSAASKPPAMFQWFLNGKALSDSGPQLKLMNIHRNQTGKYSCQAFNNKTLRYQTSQPSLVAIQSLVSDVTATSNVTQLYEFGGSVSLSCSSSGSSLSFLWLNGSSEVTVSDRVQITNTDGGSTLTILNVTRYDQGPFRCNVSNGISEGMSQPISLFIKYGPDNTAIIGPDSVHVGDFTVLHCSTESVPSAQFSWLFNGNPTGDGGAVHVIETSRSSDSGNYTCTAVNLVTMQHQTTSHKLTVIDFSDRDCSVVATNAILITAGCCLGIAIVCGIIACCLVRIKRRGNNNYPAHHKEKLNVMGHYAESYKTRPSAATAVADLYAVPMKKKKNSEPAK